MFVKKTIYSFPFFSGLFSSQVSSFFMSESLHYQQVLGLPTYL